MIKPIKKFAINWTDGMKISERHLIAHDDFILDTFRDAISLRNNNFNYGLLPIEFKKDHNETIFDVYNSATNDVHVEIKYCAAITPAGYRIELFDFKTSINSLMKLYEEKRENIEEAYYILISCNPFDHVPFGDIDPDETPPRHPFTQAKYNIEMLAESALQNGNTGGNYIIVGKVNIKDHIASADQNFIPPCTSIYSHPALLAYYSSFAKSMGNLQQFALLIVQKAVKVQQNTTLAANVKSFCETLIIHFDRVYFNYRNIVPQQAPIFMLEVFSSMALRLYNNTQILAVGELEEMLNYIFEWSEIAPYALLNQLSVVAEMNYDHNNCGAHLHEVHALLKHLEIIFSKLSGLDYIGQRKENIIINEKDITPISKAKKGWSLLD